MFIKKRRVDIFQRQVRCAFPTWKNMSDSWRIAPGLDLVILSAFLWIEGAPFCGQLVGLPCPDASRRGDMGTTPFLSPLDPIDYRFTLARKGNETKCDENDEKWKQLVFLFEPFFWGESMLIANQMIFQGVVVVVVVVVICCVVFWHISFQRQSTPGSQECGINSFTNGTACFCVLKGGKTWRTEGSECFTDERLEAKNDTIRSLLLQIFCRGFCGKQTELQILPWSLGVGSSPRDLPTRPIWNSLWSEHGTFPTESLHLYKLTNSFMTCQHPSYNNIFEELFESTKTEKTKYMKDKYNTSKILACLFQSKNYWRSDLAFGQRCISTSILQGKPHKTQPKKGVI